jgi:nucleoside-diphosphate-sugar epimerase
MTGLTHGWPEARRPGRVVVIGAGGFVGQAIVAALEARDAACLALGSKDVDLSVSGAEEKLAQRLQAEDAVVMVSALTPDRGRDIATFMKNLRMMQTLCDALARQPVAHVVNIGSDAVYPDAASLVDETTPAAPNGFHGMMHLARELMLASVAKMPVAYLRPSLLYGAGDTHNGYGPNRYRRTAASDGKIQLFGNGEEQRDHVYIDDVAELVWRCLAHRSSGTLNIATGQSASFREVADTVAAQFGKPVAVLTQARAANAVITHRHYQVAARIRAFPDFVPTPLAAGIAATHRREALG